MGGKISACWEKDFETLKLLIGASKGLRLSFLVFFYYLKRIQTTTNIRFMSLQKFDILVNISFLRVLGMNKQGGGNGSECSTEVD